MQKLSLIAGVLTVFAMSASGATVLADFESGGLTGWTLTGTWTVGGATGSSPNITPGEGQLFARSGAPNVTAGDLSESNVGSATSQAFTATSKTLSWISAGWSGQIYDASSHYEILNAALTPLTTIATAQSDNWQPVSVDLSTLGLYQGDTFYFRAVDGRSQTSYAWVAFDAITLSGDSLPNAPAPEPASVCLILAGAAMMTVVHSRRTQR